MPENCTNRVTVRADELAFRDLVEDALLVDPLAEDAQASNFLGAGKVIPLHRGRREHAAAVGAGLARFEADVPGDELRHPGTFLRDAASAVALVISGVVRLSARLAPWLPAVPTFPSVEGIQGLLPTTPTAPFEHVVRLRAGSVVCRDFCKVVTTRR
jgi:hypothetical protein